MAINNEEKEVTTPEILAGITAYKNRVQNFKLLKDGIERKYVNDELDLEDRQQESVLKLIEDTEDEKYKDKGYFHACTAFGKTYLMIAIAEGYRHKVKDKKIVIFEENATVLEQVKKDFIEKTSFLETDVGAYYGKEKTPDAPIIVCTYASMKKLIAEVGRENIGLALCDEAHHILSENRQAVAKYLDHSCLYGFTATPEYDDVKSCAQVFGEAIDSVTLKQGINNGLLCGFKNGLIVSKSPIDLSEAVDSSGDYNIGRLDEIFSHSQFHSMREELADFYLYGKDDILGSIYGKTTIINASSQKEANQLASVFNKKAHKTIAKAYHTNSGEEPLEEFNKGKFPVLIQVNKVSEGYSNPNVEVCINYPTASRVRCYQRGGRALRRNKDNPNKVALIMDIVFTKDNKKDFLTSVRENKQILFYDVVEDFMYISNPKQQILKQQSENIIQDSLQVPNKKEEIKKSKLFNILTDYEDLFDIGFESEINEEISQKDIEDTDIIKEIFYQHITVRNEKGRALRHNEKRKIYCEALKEMPSLFVYKRGKPVITQENQNKFKDYMKTKGYTVNFPSEFGKKSNEGITRRIFADETTIITKDGRKLFERKAKLALFNEVAKLRPDLHTLVRNGVHTYYEIPIKEQENYKKYLKENIISIKNYGDIDVKDVFFPGEELREIKELDLEKGITEKEIDITYGVFVRSVTIIDRNGNVLNQDNKKELFKQLAKDREDLFIAVKSGEKIVQVIPADNKELVKAYMKEKGFLIAFRDEKNEVFAKKIDTDMDIDAFERKVYIGDNKKALSYEEKNKIYNDLSRSNRDLFKLVENDGQITLVLPEENIQSVIQLLEEKGFTAILKKQKGKDDIDRRVFCNYISIKKGKKFLDPNEKSNLWINLAKENPLIFEKIGYGTFGIFHIVRHKDKSKLKKCLKEEGYEIIFMNEKTKRNRMEKDILEQRQSRDELQKYGFENYTSVIYKDTILKPNEKTLVWKFMLEKFPNIFNENKKLNKEGQEKLREILKKYNIEVFYRGELPDKKETDILPSVINNCKVMQGDIVLDNEKRKKILADAMREKRELFVWVKSVTRTSLALPIENKDKFMNYFKEKGYTIIFPDEKEKTKNISQEIFKRNSGNDGM